MKRAIKTVSICIIVVMFVLNVNAQRSGDEMGASTEGVSFGVKAGLNLSNLKESGGGMSITYSSLANVTVGGYALFHLKPSFGIQGELLYSGAGAKVSGSGKAVLSYLYIPVLAKYTFANSGFGIFAGPQLGFLLSAKSKPDGGGSTDVKDSFKSTDFSGILGADYTFGAGFNIGARYQLGLSDINNSGSGTTVKNTAFNITVGYTF